MNQRVGSAVPVVFLLLFCLFSAWAWAGSDPASSDTPPLHRVKVYHDRSLRDLDAIGNRNVGCGRGLGNWYSIEGQIRMGKEYSQQVEQTAKMVKDPVITEYINRIGQNLVRNSDSPVPFTIRVIDSDDVNAFALPGGFFYVNSGLMLAADNEAELAGVMAHEIAHVAARHYMEMQRKDEAWNIATLAGILFGGAILRHVLYYGGC